MKWTGLFLPLALGAWAPLLIASPFDDLHSPSPDVRAHAAQLIRDNHLYKAPRRAPWDDLLVSFRENELATDFIKSLQQKGVGFRLTSSMLASDQLPFHSLFLIPLDEVWELRCFFKNGRLMDWKLVEDPKEIWVSPPAGYSGTWHTYRIDGSSVTHLYENGQSVILE